MWCDLTRLLGGEDFWHDIELAIRSRARKFIFVLSRSSNQKEGPLQELHVAQSVARDQGLADFVIPVLIDDLPHRETNIQLARINSIPFNHGWASGLRALLRKLDQDGVARNPRFTPQSVASWWQSQCSEAHTIIDEPEAYLSNWFPLTGIPSRLYIHTLRVQHLRHRTPEKFPYPAYRSGSFLISFAGSRDFSAARDFPDEIVETDQTSLMDFIERSDSPHGIDRRQRRNTVIRILRSAWEKSLEARHISTYRLSGYNQAAYIRRGFVPDDRVHFTGVSGHSTYRNLIGVHRTRRDEQRNVLSRSYWHFAIQAKPMVYPQIAYIVKPHVLFSHDGNHIWKNKNRLHRGRRSECRDWWNPEWRDRTLAFMKLLSGEHNTIRLELASDALAQVASTPVEFTSPVRYDDPDTWSEPSELQASDNIHAAT